MTLFIAALALGSLVPASGFALFDLQRQADALSRSSPIPFWSCKNANAKRTGAAAQVGPRNISQTSWAFEETIGYGAIEASPVIDASYNTYIGSTAGGLFAIRRNGTLFWSRRFPGRIMSPALADGILYVATSKAWVYAIDAATGASLWEREIAPTAGSDAWSVTMAQDTVLVPAITLHDDGNYRIYALRASDGSEKWALSLDESVYNFMPLVLGDDFIFMNRLGSVVRVSLHDGSILWKTLPVEGSFSTGGVVLGPNDLVFATSNANGTRDGMVHAHSVEDGQLRWTKHFDVEAAAAPAVLDVPGMEPSVIVATGHNCMSVKGLLHTGKVVALDVETGEERWGFTPAVHVGEMAKGVERGLGNHMEAFSVPDTWTNPAIGGDGTIYIGWHGGIVYALDGRTGAEVSKHDVGYSFQGEPAIAPGYLVVPSIYRLVAFDESI